MPRNTSVSLGDHFSGFIESRVETGRYNSASDVVRAGLRLLEAEETKLERLRAEIEMGIASGIAQDFDWNAFRAQKRAEHEAKQQVAK